MRFRSLILTVAACAALVFTNSRTSEANPEFVMNFGTVAPDGTPWADQLRAIKKRVERESNGRIQIKLFLGGSLGSEIEMIHDVARGERLQGGGFSTGSIGQALDIPILLLPELPYLFRNNDEADTVLDKVLYTPVNQALADKGFTMAAWAENGWRNFATNGGPATSPAELAKYKMRSQESPVHLDMYKALGVQAVAKPVSEVLPALNTGIVEGFDNTPLFSLAAGWTEPITHYTLSRHIYQPAGVVYSKKFFDSLPSDLQTILMGDPAKESVDGRVAVRVLEQELLDTFRGMGKQVIELSDDQVKAFRQATRPVHKQFLAAHPDMVSVYGQVKAKLQSMRQ